MYKPMTYKIDTCHYLARQAALLGLGKNWLAQYQDNTKSGYGGLSLVFRFGSAIKLPCLHCCKLGARSNIVRM